MKKGWPTKPVGEVCPISSRKPNAFVGTRRYFSTGAVGSEGELAEPELVDFANRPSRAGCMPEVGDIGFARMKGTKKVILIDESLKGALFSTGFCFLAPRPNVEPRFAFYFVTSDDFQDAKNGVAGDGIMGGIKNSDAAAIGMPLPPLAEQQRIVGLLDEAFEGLATAKANAEKNLQNARALFEIHLQSVFTQRGPGWVETTIGDQLTLQRGFDITKVQQNTGEVPVVSSGGIKSYHDKAMAKGPGVVIGRKGTLGKVFYTESDYWPHDTTLWVKDFKGNEPRFVYYLFAGLNVKKLDSGAANPALNRNQVHPIEVTWPQVAQQKALVETLDALEEETQRLARLYERKHAALEALKKSLLHQAFTGAL